MLIQRTSVSGKVHEMEIPITFDELCNWAKGWMVIQQAFPNLTTAQREFLLSGMTQEEWDEICSDDNDDESDFGNTILI
jgi:hypothetical protein